MSVHSGINTFDDVWRLMFVFVTSGTLDKEDIMFLCQVDTRTTCQNVTGLLDSICYRHPVGYIHMA